MKSFKSLLVIPALVATMAADAAVYTVSGSQLSVTAPTSYAITYSGGTPTFTGTFDDATGQFNFTFADYTATITSGSYSAVWTVSGQNLALTGTGDLVRSYGSQSCVGDAQACWALPVAPQYPLSPASFTVTEGVLAGTLSLSEYTNTDDPFTTVYGFGNEVPVPAAAWLFGSGLLGLAAARRAKG